MCIHFILIPKWLNYISCLLILFQHQPISLQYSWLSFEQPITIDWVLYKHHWEFSTHKQIIPMLTYLITFFILCNGSMILMWVQWLAEPRPDTKDEKHLMKMTVLFRTTCTCIYIVSFYFYCTRQSIICLSSQLFVRLWLHEVFRVYYDRLVDNGDRDWLYTYSKQVVKDVLNKDFNQVYTYVTTCTCTIYLDMQQQVSVIIRWYYDTVAINLTIKFCICQILTINVFFVAFFLYCCKKNVFSKK